MKTKLCIKLSLFPTYTISISFVLNKFSAISQLGYMLGDAGRSYVVGFGKNPPKQPHHSYGHKLAPS